MNENTEFGFYKFSCTSVFYVYPENYCAKIIERSGRSNTTLMNYVDSITDKNNYINIGIFNKSLRNARMPFLPSEMN